MSHFNQATALVGRAKEDLVRIREEYESSLDQSEVKVDLLIAIKNFMENLRSALDYCAHGLFARYGTASRANPRIYFPYALDGQSEAEFRTARRIEVCIPGLTASRPDVVAKLESFQAFASPDNAWVPVFMDLNNENKHQHLTPQTRKETPQLDISSGGAGISLGEGASISMGPGTSITVGGLTLPGGQRFDSSNPPLAHGQGSIKVTKWVSFHFTDNDEPVLPLLESAVSGTEAIVMALASM